MSTFKMAWRNIWRNRRRTMVTVAAMTIAVLITINYAALANGMLVQLESNTLDFELGAAQIFAKGYQDRPSIYKNIADTDGILKRLEAEGLVATPRLLGGGLVAFGEASAGAFLRGVDLQRDGKVLALTRQVDQGSWLAAEDKKGVVIGRKLARTLGIKPGNKLVVLSQAADGSTGNDLFTIRGILKGVGEQTDRGGVFMSQAAFRELLAFEGGAHQIIIKRPKLLDTATLKAAAVRAAPNQDVQSWRDLVPTLATMMDSMAGLISIMFLIVNVAIGIVILNAMLMSVFERIREFGVLKALGIGPGGVLKLIYAEAGFQVCLAVTAGVLIAAPLLWYLATTGIDMASLAGTSMMGMVMMENWYAVITPAVFAQPISVTIIVVALATLYPAIKAAVIRPVQAMRHQ